MHSLPLKRAMAALCFSACTLSAHADTAAADGGDASAASPAELSRVTIVGSSAAALEIAGSAHFIGPEELERFEYADVHRILRSVPGVYLQDEEGFGQRPNIGIRGSGQDRSSRIAILEDGVLIAPAPYSAPAAYYFPTARRIYAVEVLKGPAAIPVGPRTIGGAINMISTPIPDEWTVYGDYFYGSNSSHDAHLVAGGSGEYFGLMVETVQQESDGFKRIDANDRNRDAGYDIEDYVVKGRINTSSSAAIYQALEFKYGRTKQDAQQSYLGLTDEDFSANPFRLYAATQIDQLDTDFKLRQLSWVIEPDSQPWKLNFTGYNNAFERSWYRVNNVNGVGLSAIVEDPVVYAEQLGWLRGDTSPDDALRARDNARDYESRGVQGGGEYALSTGFAEVLLKGGFRFHEDEEDRLQREDRWRMEANNMVLTTPGARGGQENRVGEADVTSGFVSADIDIGAWRVSPGLRYESIDLKRSDYALTDPTRAAGPTRVLESDLTEWISGIGVTYALNDRVRLIGGVHEGFNPPAPGSTAKAETSTNWEFGLRYAGDRFNAEAIGFVTDYDNLVGTVTESTGGGGEIGDQFDGGEAVVRGIELMGDTVLWEFGGGWRVPARLSWTWTPEAEFRNSFQSSFAPWGNVLDGDEMPYVPENLGQLQLGLEQDRFEMFLNFVYQSETRTRAGRGSIPNEEATDSFVVVDLGTAYRLNQNLSLVARVQNLFDNEYIASRSPNGARPGIDRWAMVGLRASF
jgi:Fe(3+) dicitrate transport protein